MYIKQESKKQKIRAVGDMPSHFSLLAGTQPSVSCLWGMNNAIRVGIQVGRGNNCVSLRNEDKLKP